MELLVLIYLICSLYLMLIFTWLSNIHAITCITCQFVYSTWIIVILFFGKLLLYCINCAEGYLKIGLFK
jgi:hypothetical protein